MFISLQPGARSAAVHLSLRALLPAHIPTMSQKSKNLNTKMCKKQFPINLHLTNRPKGMTVEAKSEGNSYAYDS